MDIYNAMIEQLNKVIDKGYERICHCVEQLNEEHIWHRESAYVNSIGIIIKHLCGNLRQWIIAGIAGQQDIRNRPAEFKDEERLTKDQLMSQFASIIQDCKTTIREIKPEQFLQYKRIQGFDETVLSAMYHAIPHIELHAGQIVYITRLLLQDQYQLQWEPQTKEEGAE